MSQKDNPFGEQQWSTPVTQARWLPSRLLVVMSVLFVFGLFACIALLIFGVQKTLFKNSAVDQNVQPYEMDDFSRVSQAVIQAANPRSGEDTAQIKKMIQSFLDSIEHGDNFEHVDADGFIAQVRRSGKCPSMGVFDLMWIRGDIESSMNLPNHYEHFHVHAIESLSDDWVVVYLTFWDSDNWIRSEPQRWWLVKRDEKWKFADFQSLHMSHSEAADFAYRCQYAEDPRIGAYYDFYDDLNEAYDAIGTDDEEALAIFDELLSKPVPPPFLGDLRFHKSVALEYLQEHERVAQVLAKVEAPDRTPGIHLQRAWNAFDQEQYSLAIKHCDAFLALVGRSVTASYIHAQCFRELGETEKEIAAWNRILQIQPNNTAPLSSFLETLPTSRYSELVTLLESCSDPASTAMELAENFYFRTEYRLLPLLADLVQKRGTLADANYLRGRHWQSQRDYEKAAETFLMAMNDPISGQSLKDATFRYIDVMMEMGKLVEAYENSPDRDEAFHQMMDRAGLSNLASSAEERLRLIEMREPERSGDPTIGYYRFCALSQIDRSQGKVASADSVDVLRKAGSLGGMDDATRDLIDHQWTLLAVEQNTPMQRYLESDGDEEVFNELARMLIPRRDTKTFQPVLEKHMATRTTNYDARMVEAFAAELARDFDRAITIVEANEPQEESRLPAHVQRLARLIALRGNWQDDVRRSSQQATIAPALADHFLSQSHWDDLQSLVQIHEELEVDASEIDRWRLELAVHQGDEQGIVDAATRSGSKLWSDYELMVSEMPIRSLVAMLRRKDWDAAEQLAERCKQAGRSHAPLLFYLQKGDREQTELYLQELSDSGDLNELELWPDLVAPLSQQPRFAGLAEKFAQRTLYSFVTVNECHLFYSANTAPTAEDIKKLLSERLSTPFDFELCPLDHFDRGNVEYVIRVKSDKATMLVVLAKSDVGGNLLQTNTPIPEIASHTHCLTIGVVNPLGRFQLGTEMLVTEIAAAIASGDCLGAYCAWESLFLPHPTIDLACRREGMQVGFHTFLKLEPWLEKPPTWQLRRDVYRKMAEFERTNSKDSEPQPGAIELQKPEPSEEAGPRVRIGIDVGLVRESLWLRVIGIDPNDDSAESLLCVHEGESVILDKIQPGRKVLVTLDQILQWE